MPWMASEGCFASIVIPNCFGTDWGKHIREAGSPFVVVDRMAGHLRTISWSPSVNQALRYVEISSTDPIVHLHVFPQDGGYPQNAEVMLDFSDTVYGRRSTSGIRFDRTGVTALMCDTFGASVAPVVYHAPRVR